MSGLQLLPSFSLDGCRSQQPRQVLVYDESDASPWENANEVRAQTSIEAAYTLLCPGLLDTCRDRRV